MWALAAQLSHKISTDSIAVLNSFKSGRCVDDVDGATPPFRCSDIFSPTLPSPLYSALHLLPPAWYLPLCAMWLRSVCEPPLLFPLIKVQK